MFRALLQLLVIKVSHVGWKEGSAFCTASMDEKEDDYPVRDYIEGLRETQVEAMLLSADTEILGEALGDSPELRGFNSAEERLIRETLDAIEEDPATKAFERMVNDQLRRLHKKVINDPATKKLVMAKRVTLDQIKKRMGFPTEH